MRVDDADPVDRVGSWTGAEAVGVDPRRGQSNTRHRTERRGDKIGSSEEESQDVWFQ